MRKDRCRKARSLLFYAETIRETGGPQVFALDSRLKNDCFVLCRLNLSHLLLMNNALFPWFILVPETDVTELCDLSVDEQQILIDEINRVSRFIKARFTVDKLNVAAIGNVVSQLHIHVIGRRMTDECWPGVVWGAGKSEPYPDAERQRIVRLVESDPEFSRPSWFKH